MLGAQTHCKATCSLLALGPVSGHCLRPGKGDPGEEKACLSLRSKLSSKPLPHPRVRTDPHAAPFKPYRLLYGRQAQPHLHSPAFLLPRLATSETSRAGRAVFLGGIIEVMFIYPGSFWARANYVHLTALNNHKVTLQGPGTFERHPQDNLVR